MRVLHAIHDFLPRHRAGSGIYAFHLCRELSRRHDVAVLCAEYDPTRPHGSITRRVFDDVPVIELVNNWAFDRFEESYRSPALNRVLDHVLADVRPDVLHIHNLLNLSIDLPKLARARGIPSVATLHDYTLVCPSGGQRVHMAEQHVCDIIDPDRCSRCFPQSPFYAQMTGHWAARTAGRSPAALRMADAVRRRAPRVFAALQRGLTTPAAPAIDAAAITRRLQHVREMFEVVDLFVAPSAALASEYRALGMPAAKLRVSDYGFVPLGAVTRARGAKLRIGFVGTFVWHKGVHLLLEAVAVLPPDRFELKLFGDLTVFPDYVQTLRDLARNLPVRFMGGFDESKRGDVYESIDVLVVPSLWPENSPLVIHEAFMAGVPVVGARQGGIPELVTDGISGFTYEAYSPGDLAAALRRLIDDPQLVDAFALALPAVKPMLQDALEWEAVYTAVSGGEARRSAASS